MTLRIVGAGVGRTGTHSLKIALEQLLGGPCYHMVEVSRLFEWQPADGWGPLCDALAVPVPEAPFPVTNTTADFRAMAGLDKTE